ncbi:hypothetical protein XELAEV_18013311mg [Xenopus laevis]|uniref:Uncharacterized protein n=1 Tax=Xenopus laevis TaxID=8355 RepID=A0A974DPC0_XENLA|nr:hypothetical protein XELAEV_18013311mg [Xenopus laevis]
MKTRNLNVLQTHLTLKPGTRSLVPCKFLPVHPIDMTKIKLEWGKLSLEEGKYTPLIQLNSEGIRRHPEIDHRFGLFVPLVKKGNCTLIIDSIDAKDTGVYEVWMALDGRLHEAYPKTKTTISDQKQASGASRANVKLTVMATSIMSTTAETASNQTDYFVMLLDDKHGRTTIIVVIAVLSILSVSALITTIMCCIYFLDDDDDDDDETTDVEAPKEDTPKSAQWKDSVQIEDETTTDSESEKQEAKSMKDSVHIEDETTTEKEEEEAKFTSTESESDKSDDWESDKSDKSASEYESETSSEEESSEKPG